MKSFFKTFIIIYLFAIVISYILSITKQNKPIPSIKQPSNIILTDFFSKNYALKIASHLNNIKIINITKLNISSFDKLDKLLKKNKSYNIISTGYTAKIANYLAQNFKINHLVFVDNNVINNPIPLSNKLANGLLLSTVSYFIRILDILVADFGYFNLTKIYHYFAFLKELENFPKLKNLQQNNSLILNVYDKSKSKEINSLINYQIKPNSVFMSAKNPTDLTLKIKNFFNNIYQPKIQTKLLHQKIKIIKYKGVMLFSFFILVLLAALITEDLTSIAVGLIILSGHITFIEGVLATSLGILVGDFFLFYLGYLLNYSIFKNNNFLSKKIKKSSIEKIKAKINKKGSLFIFLTRFLPGTRFISYVSLGIIKYSFIKFAIIMTIAVLIWTTAILYMINIFGEIFYQYLAEYQFLIVLLLIIFMFFLWQIISLSSKEKRQLLHSKFLRIKHWEFWNTWLFYLPIFPWIIYLMIKYRSIRLPILSNTSITNGGLIGENKFEILETIAKTGNNKKYLPIDKLIKINSFSNRILEIKQFIHTNNLIYPIVIKPVIGEKSRNVLIAKNFTEIENYLKNLNIQNIDLIAQEFITGKEFGLFYIKLPQKKQGYIFSLTEKYKLFVKGDGILTLKQLIFKDKDAFFMLPTHLKKHEDHLDKIIAKDKIFYLTDVGAHCLGAKCFNHIDKISTKLTNTTNKISKSIQGFYIGRFDVIAKNGLEGLLKGEFKILELNGITSVPMHIYERNYPLIQAYKDYYELWNKIFQIASYNFQSGYSLPSYQKIFKLIANGFKK